jgi:hypothetical protein
MSHFQIICKECKDIMSQCRCPSKDKTTTYELCDKCKAKNPEQKQNLQ